MNAPSLSRAIRGAALVLLACVTLAACDTSVNTSATANVPAQYTNVFVTVKELWVNPNRTAAPEDEGWLRFTLDQPQTLNLVDLNDGTLIGLANQLAIPPGTYREMRLVLSDRTETLTASAQSAGAIFNNQVDFTDIDGNPRTLPLELANAAQGIGIELELRVPSPTSAILAASARTTPNTTGTSSLFSNVDDGSFDPDDINTGAFDQTNVPNTGSTGSRNDTGSSTTNPDSTVDDTSTERGNNASTVTATAVIFFDAARDLTLFNFSDQPGFVLNPSLAARDRRAAGTIRGTLDFINLTIDTDTGRPDIQVSAQFLADPSSTRHSVALNAAVSTDGTFVLYPLPAGDGDPTEYDLVVHGPGIRTIILKAVPVTRGDPSSTSSVTLSLTPTAAQPYLVNVAANSPVTQRGARVGFYQTLPANGEVPYLIEERVIDPLSGTFALDALISGSPDIVSGTFAQNELLQLTVNTPAEGPSRYRVAASAALLGDGAFSATSLAPPANPTLDTATFAVPAIPIPATATAGTITTTLNLANPGTFDQGALFVTQNGAIVSVTSLDAALFSATETIEVPDVPAGGATPFERGVYYVEAWAWSSGNPEATFVRQPGVALIDLRNTATGTATVDLN